MSTSKGYGGIIRTGITLFLAAILYQLIVVMLLGNKGYDLRVGRNVFLFQPLHQFIPVLLFSCFIVFFIGEYSFRYKRTSQNLLVLFCGISLLVLLFLFAKHIHRLYYTTAHKFDTAPRNIGLPADSWKNPAGVLLKARNVLLGIDAFLALCMIYLWYFWAEVPAKKQ